METASEMQALEQEQRNINRRIHAIRDAERYNENKELLGKTFRYRNSFSTPRGSRDSWWLYAKVQKVSKDGYLTVFFFETDKNGRTTIFTDKFRRDMSDHRPISEAAFNKAWRDMQRNIKDTRP